MQALGTAQMQPGALRGTRSTLINARSTPWRGKNASPAAIGQIYTMLGNANLKLKKNDAAIAAYNKAAALSPNPAVAYFNVCAVMYNMGQPAAKTAAACDKAIAADPKKADAYFIKGSVAVRRGSD